MLARFLIVLLFGVLSASPAAGQLLAQVPIDETLPCLQRVDDITWVRSAENRPLQDLWCRSVGKPIYERPPLKLKPYAVTGLLILSWNVHVGGGRLEDLLPRLLDNATRNRMGLVVLLQEAFRSGEAVPEVVPANPKVPRAIRPRRPAMDIAGIAKRFGLSLAYVPSMRNGAATGVGEREDRGNAILSTELLLDVQAIELPFGKQRRVALAAMVQPEGTEVLAVRVITAHFDSGDHRVAQASVLSDRITFYTDRPIVIGADLNARLGVHDGAVLGISNRVPLLSCGTGQTMRWPLRLDVIAAVGRPDFMFASSTPNTTILRSCETLSQAYGSDHVPLLLTFRY